MSNNLSKRITLPFLIKFTLPSIIVMVFTALYTIVDGFFVSNFVNTDALSAVNIVYPVINVVYAIGLMFSTGLTAIVARKVGEGRREEACRVFSFVSLCAALFGVVLTAVSFFGLDGIIRLLGSNDALFDYCRDYALTILGFFPFSILQLLFQNMMVADGRPGLGLITSLAGGITNMILDYVFIVPMGMGVAGAALATGIGYCVPTVAGLIYFSVRRGGICFVKPLADWRSLLHSITNGSSEMVSNLAMSVTTFLFNIIMMRTLGQDGVAAITIVMYLDFLLVSVNLGYSMGVAPLISYNYGAQDNEKLKKLFRMSMMLLTGFSVLMTAGALLFPGPLSAVFAKPGTDVYRFAVHGLLIYAVSYLFKGYNIFASAMFTAFSDGKTSAILSFLRTFLFLVVCTLGMTALFGADGVWLAAPAAEILALAVTVFCFAKYRRFYHYL
ncbi:MATE family efflux transporter [Fumia xinanensis]|uniref:Multidrug export protein MepA n=1 Tax=Fumia xinanensis TaxID=2763659 RepID=A0A926E694_9FIRM|nr:MATE family efflux transporter [Fumia xinanensis]MBC8560315.1 MATE family efflux transporter [Fumia xinanensis]